MLRHSLTLLIVAVLAPVLNIAIACGCALCSNPCHGRYREAVAISLGQGEEQQIYWCDPIAIPRGEWFQVSEFSNSAVTFIVASRSKLTIPPEFQHLRDPVRRPPPPTRAHPDSLLPNWGSLQAPSPEFQAHDSTDEERHIFGAGWPLRALWSEPVAFVHRRQYWPTVDTLPTQGGLLHTSLTPWRALSSINCPRAIPLRPYWPGFLINTTLYALVLSFLAFTLFVIRRRPRSSHTFTAVA